MKRSGPSLRQQAVELEKCGTCHGSGFVKPMFYELPCTGCNAGGWVNKETGEALALEDLVVQLRLKVNELGAKNRELHRRLAECGQPERGYGPMGQPIRGD